MSSYLKIVFDLDFELVFKIESTVPAALWLEKMYQRHKWPLDDPTRFYGFNDVETEKIIAERDLEICIRTINAYQPIIDKKFTNIYDQDLLNYLHHIFERYHGLLNSQDTDWWVSAPSQVRQALANLNIAIHRAESTATNNHPRFVCTWFGMRKHEQFTKEIIETFGHTHYEFGGVYVNYVEIGKTLEDLSIDNDQWIGEDAFRPFLHYSADFNVRFYDDSAALDQVAKYYRQHSGFFENYGIFSPDDYRARPCRFKVASLEQHEPREIILQKLAKRQLITNIYLV